MNTIANITAETKDNALYSRNLDESNNWADSKINEFVLYQTEYNNRKESKEEYFFEDYQE